MYTYIYTYVAICVYIYIFPKTIDHFGFFAHFSDVSIDVGNPWLVWSLRLGPSS